MVELWLVGQERKIFPGRPRDEERSPAVAIRVAENGNVPPKRHPNALANFFPDISWRDRIFGKERAAGIGFRLETQHAPDVTATRIRQIPADHFWHVVDVAARDGEAERILENATGPLEIGRASCR